MLPEFERPQSDEPVAGCSEGGEDSYVAFNVELTPTGIADVAALVGVIDGWLVGPGFQVTQCPTGELTITAYSEVGRASVDAMADYLDADVRVLRVDQVTEPTE